MASTAIHTHAHRNIPQSLAGLIVAPFRAVGGLLLSMGESGRMAREFQKLNQVSDEELAAGGKTREGEIRRILGSLSCI